MTLYGAPQLSATAVGKRSPRGAARKVKQQAKAYRKIDDRRVISGFDLIGTVATASAGSDRKYRTRQSDQVIAKYLSQARKLGGRLVLDIQPGRSTVAKEINALRPWISQPDVDVAIDPEWNVGPKGVPGRTEGSIAAKEINGASRKLAGIVERKGLPPKLMLVHQFRQGSVRKRRQVRQRGDISVALNFDGIGGARAKKAGYKNLATPQLFNGFSVFYDLDERVMKPREILRLNPAVDFLLYQ